MFDDSSAPDTGAADSHSVHEVDEIVPSVLPKDATMDRTELLRSRPEVIGRFLHLMVPILVDVYAASVITPVRIKTLTGLLKAVSFLDGEEVKQVFSVSPLTSFSPGNANTSLGQFVPVASFASSILSSKDHPTLVIGALQLVELLLNKVPAEYKPVFRREGVFHEIETLASRNITSSKSKEKDKDKDSDASSPAEPAIPAHVPISAALAATIPGFKKLSSLALDPDDAITLRARVIRFKYLTGDDEADSDDVFATLRRLVEHISDQSASEKDLNTALSELAGLFASPHTSVSSFELLQSGVVDGLLQLVTGEERNGTNIFILLSTSTLITVCVIVSLSRRKDMLYSAFSVRRSRGASGGQTPFAIFVKKLQESLTRMESFEVVTVAQSADGRCIDLSSVFSGYSLTPAQIRNGVHLPYSLVNYDSA